MPKNTSKVNHQNAEALFLEAERFEERRDFRKAFRCLLKAAELGHSSSQLKLGNFYASGTGVRKNPARRRIGIERRTGETLAQVLPRLANIPLDFQPGTRWAYSSQYGFDVLARIVEVASGMPLDRFVEQRIAGPLGMKDTSFYRDGLQARRATLYQRVNGALQKVADQPWVNGVYFPGGGGLSSTAEDYLRFALMLANGGELHGTRILSRRPVGTMTSVSAPDTRPGRNAGEGFGLGVRVVTDPTARNTWLSQGSFGWSGAYNTHFFIDPKEKVIAIFMTQVTFLDTRGQLRDDFETAVMQAVVGNRAPRVP